MQIQNQGLIAGIAQVKGVLSRYADQMQRLDQEYKSLLKELEDSFTESKNYWNRKTDEEIQARQSTSNTLASRMNEMANGLHSLDVQLEQIDPSYAKRKATFIIGADSSIIESTAEALVARMERVVKEAKAIASECSLTVKAQPLQELSMLFSSKRKKQYARLAELIDEGKRIREKFGSINYSGAETEREKLTKKRDEEIDKAANETAELIAALEDRHKRENTTTINQYWQELTSVLDRSDIEDYRKTVDELSSADGTVFSEYARIGNIGVNLGDLVTNPYAVSMVNELYHGFIVNQSLSLPVLFDLKERANLMLFDKGESKRTHTAMCSMIYSLLRSQPASQQKIILYDPEGRGQSYSLFLEFIGAFPSVMSGRVFVTKQQIREQLESLSNFVDEFSQTKLATNNTIFEYNSVSIDRPEPLKCLCLLNFPQYFDEQMLELLYNIVKNGSPCGVQTIIQLDEQALSDTAGKTYEELLHKITEYCITIQGVTGGWSINSDVWWEFNELPSRTEFDEFFSSFKEQFSTTTSRVLPIAKIIPHEDWYSKSTIDLLALPVGKDDAGKVQYIEFGDPIGSGVSHHALVAGSLGSGKSTLLHTIIMGALTSYSPDELNLYLLDFKSGTEFKIYSDYNIPHIKVLALDAMQEFGKSVLDDLEAKMKQRLEMIQERRCKDLTEYRRLTGEKIPRILVVMDEFQLLFSEAHNRRVANDCAKVFSDMISLYRVCGIHFIIATQTLSRLRSGFTIPTSTLNEMYVRIGLKCSEMECSYLFGEAQSRKAFSQMGDVKGTAVYCEEFEKTPTKGFKVALCDTDTQKLMLKEIEDHFGPLDNAEPARVFIGDAVPKLDDCKEYEHISGSGTSSAIQIYLGESIRIGDPVALNVSRLKRCTLLVVGSHRPLLEQVIAVYMSNALKYVSASRDILNPTSIYLFDGLTIMGEPFSAKIGNVIENYPGRIKWAKDVFDVLPLIDELYSLFLDRKKSRMSGKGDFPFVHVVINDFQWIEPIGLVLNNKPVDDFVAAKTTTGPGPADTGALFGYLNDKKQSELDSSMDSLLAGFATGGEGEASKVSYNKKLMTLIESGYTCGINVIMSTQDFISIKELIYECVPKFQNKILFALSDKDADRIITDAQVEKLKKNIALFYDGVNPAYQFKPFDL